MPDAEQRRLRNDKRCLLGDGIAYGVMVGSGEAYVAAFALAVGLGDVVAGLVATLPLLAGAVLQLVTPAALRRLGSYRRWVVACARLQAGMLLVLAGFGAWGAISASFLFAAMAAYWGFGMATSPAWNAWVGSLVPPGERAHFFARRQRWGQVALFAGVLGGGVLLHRSAAWGWGPAVFALLFAVAAIARWISAHFLAGQSEAPELARLPAHVSPVRAVWTLRGTEAGRVLVYLTAAQLAVNVAAPYFTPYMLGPLGLSYGRFTALTAAAFLARVALLPVLGRAAQARGTGWLFRVGAVAVTPLPALWLVSDHFGWLLALQVFAGASWAALELATLLSFFESLEERSRASVLTAFNLVHTAAMALGALAGAGLFRLFDAGGWAYAAIFLASSTARLLALALLRIEPPPAGVPVPDEIALRTLAVRPSLGAIQRPVVPALEAPAPDPAPAGSGQERSPTGT